MHVKVPESLSELSTGELVQPVGNWLTVSSCAFSSAVVSAVVADPIGLGSVGAVGSDDVLRGWVSDSDEPPPPHAATSRPADTAAARPSFMCSPALDVAAILARRASRRCASGRVPRRVPDHVPFVGYALSARFSVE